MAAGTGRPYKLQVLSTNGERKLQGSANIPALSIKDLASLRKTCHHHLSLHAQSHYALGLQRDYGRYTALQWAAGRSYASLVEQAISSGARVAEPGVGRHNLGALHLAAARNNHEVIRILLKHKAPIVALDSKKCTPLHYAALCENPEGAKVLLEHGADMMSQNKDGDPPASFAVCGGRVGCMEVFIAAGFDLNFKGVTGRTLLHVGASGRVEMLRYLLQHKELKVAVITRDFSGTTPLHVARNAEILQLLLDNGADMELNDFKGNTPAHYAARDDNLSLIAAPIDVGFDIKTTGERGYTVLHTAIDYDSLDVIWYLLDEGVGAALINVHDSNGITPLALAVEMNSEEWLINLLIKHGADLEAKDLLVYSGGNTNGVQGGHEESQMRLNFLWQSG